jgi:hypothetical protein
MRGVARRSLSWALSMTIAGLFVASCAWPDPEGRWRVSEESAEDAPEAPPLRNDVDEEPVSACPSVGGIQYERPRPNVMLLVDRSGSMGEPGACAESSCPSKWQQLLALGGYLADVKRHARLGLAVFPSPVDHSCGVSSSVLVPLTDSANADRLILEAVQRVSPGGRTPIAAALDELERNGGLDDPDRDNIITLLTDGQPNCACEASDIACERDEVVAAVERLAARGVSIRLNVVGFGASAQAASETLSAMAIAAGTARQGVVSYYQAETVEELVTRLYEVAASLAPCRFYLDELPPPQNLVVHLDDTQVPACAAEPCARGYSYDVDNGVVELRGETCQAIRDGACHSVWFETRAR